MKNLIRQVVIKWMFMAEEELLYEFSTTLTNDSHKKYIQSYIDKKRNGLSEKFDALLKEGIN